MSNIFIIMMLVAMLAVVASLAMGLFSMVKGGEFNKKHGNKSLF